MSCPRYRFCFTYELLSGGWSFYIIYADDLQTAQKQFEAIPSEELERYFSPIYYVEYEVTPAGELFPQRFRVGYYHGQNKKEALQCFE